MRIVYDVSFIQKASAGIGRFSLGLLRTLLACDDRNEYVLHGWSYLIDGETIAALARRNVTLSVSRIPGGVKRLYWNRLRHPSLDSVVGRFDVFHGAEPLLPPLGRGRGIVTVHDLAYLKYPQFFQRRVLRRDLFVRRSVNEAAAIVVPSMATKADLAEIFGVDERVIRVVRPPVFPGITLSGGSLKDGDVVRRYGVTRPFGMFVGVLEPRKNVDSIIRAFEVVQSRKACPLDLVLVGRRGWLYDAVLNLIERSPVRDRIHQLDFIPDQDLASLYRSARFLVYPSFYEGFGFPVYEAMAAGLPVITSGNSSLQEIAGNAAVLIDPHNLDELVSAMKDLASNDEACSKLSALGRERIRLLNADNSAASVMRLYDEIGTR